MSIFKKSKLILSLCYGAVFCAGLFISSAQAESLFEAVAGLDKPVGSYSPETSSTLNLSGSRREKLGFLIKIRHRGCGKIKLQKLTSSKGNAVSFPFHLFRLETISTTSPSFTGAHVGGHLDPAIPLKGKTYCGNGQKIEWLLAEIRIPKNRAPGEYIGRAKFAGKLLRFNITVWPMKMPQTIRLPMYSEMSPYANLIGHFGKWTPVESELAEKYNSMLRRHNVYSLKSSIIHPRVQKTGGPPHIDIYTTPNKQDAFYPVVVKKRPKSAYYDFPTTAYSNLDEGEEDLYYQAVEKAAKELNRPGKAIFYLWDEPYPPVFPELLKLLRRVNRYSPSVKSMVTVPAYDILQPYVDIFCPVMNQYDEEGFPSPKVYADLQRQGKEVWWYVSCMSHGCEALRDTGFPDMVIERRSAWVRSIGWLSVKYSVDAFLYYMVNVGYFRYPARDPWDSLWEYSGNGDGTLVYPGRPGERGLTEHRPIASIRLKLWRESSYDAQYVQWMKSLKRKPRWFNRELDSLVKTPRRWSPHYTSYSRLRSKIGSYLAKQPRKATR
jgi:hypothetical protein